MLPGGRSQMLNLIQASWFTVSLLKARLYSCMEGLSSHVHLRPLLQNCSLNDHILFTGDFHWWPPCWAHCWDNSTCISNKKVWGRPVSPRSLFIHQRAALELPGELNSVSLAAVCRHVQFLLLMDHVGFVCLFVFLY